MKITKYLALGLLVISLTPVFGQQPPSNTFQERFAAIRAANKEAADHTPTLTKFNLDFSGGTPKELVAAIEKATGKPLNTIIPDEDADTQLPPLKMNDVSVPQLFAALEVASRKTVAVSTGQFGSYSQQQISYGFKTPDNGTDNSIWYFYAVKSTLPPMVSTEKVCQFYSLEIYLNRGLTVDDITTAIQTGWKMAGITSPPELNYHKETQLLIAFGEPKDLDTIHGVLQTLPSSAQNYDFLRMKINVENLQKQVDQLTKKISASASGAQPPLSPDDQVKLIEQNRMRSQQSQPAIAPPPPLAPKGLPVKPEAGQ